jgi:pimeloyl-[acyl-carrier protein] methyl ester esterase
MPCDSISLVLLPGMHGGGQLFTHLLRELPDFIKPVPVSYPPDQPLDYKGHLDIVMAALPSGEPFVLLGESFSGPLALMAAARNPKGLRGVILCSTFVTYPLCVPVFVADMLVSLGLFRLKLTRLFVRIVLGTKAPDELKSLFVQALADVQPEVLAARAKAVFAVDVMAELRKCPVPILVIQAGNDRLIYRKNSEQIRNLRPDADIVVINGPHMTLQCAVVEAVREIRRFVEKL